MPIIRRLCAIVILLMMPLFSACSPSNAIPREFELQLAGSPAQLELNTKLRAAIDLPITLDITETPLREALAMISSKAAMPISIDWDALKDTDMRPTTKVSLQLLNAPVREAFNILFRTVTAPDLEDKSAVWMLADGSVVVGTVATLLPHRKTISYPVEDILENLDAQAIDDPEHEHGKAKAAMFRFSDAKPNDDNAAPFDEDIDAVRDTLFALVENASSVRVEMWDSHDGVLCVMNETGGVLVLTAPEEVHRRVFLALQALRATIPPAKK